LTRLLSSIREGEGNINEASNLLQDIQIETFGSMERKEKIDFILEQMRLLKLQGDWEKMAIVSKKVNTKWLAEKENEVGISFIPQNLIEICRYDCRNSSYDF
jgi:26S proteasome regulatory subunit N5